MLFRSGILHSSQKIKPGYVKSITVKLDKKAAHSETFNLYCEVINPAAIDTIAAKKGADDVDIRDELFCFMERARICGKAGIGEGELLLTVTRETPLSTALQVHLREESGTSLAWVLMELHPVFTSILEHFSPYDASKSPFTSVRQVKYTARFGLPVADVDQKRSILKVWLAKFGDVLPLVALKKLDNEYDAIIGKTMEESHKCKGDETRDHHKELWNGLLTGGGRHHVKNWEIEAKTKAPELWRSEERRVGKECRSRWSPYH